MMFVFITMLFNGGLIPWYIVVKSLGMVNTFFALFIPGSINVWNMILMRNYFMSLPDSLEESAKLDGATDFQIYLKVVLPLSKPIIATMVVYMAVGYWNEWYSALIFVTTNKKLYTLQLLLRSILSNTSVVISSRGGRKLANINHALPPSESLRMAAVMVATIPILVIYPFVQKHFVKGIMIGSIKG
jgi:ABC-type glycerol-3-phosphate transport system permease component